MDHKQLRELPAVDQLLAGLAHLEGRFSRRLIVDEVRRTLEAVRDEIRSGVPPSSEPLAIRVERNLGRLETPSLRRVINATGVVLHTNLGRAPVPAFEPLLGYSNLEYDLAQGARGKRDVHAAELLDRLVGAPGIAVNNNAAAVYLALNELAAGYEVVVSRGELIEIGDGFRIPEIMQRSGAILREVGTTNRTRIDDYRDAINERTRLLLRVHPSNFRIEGFTARPELGELVALGKERGVPVYEDLGSGCVADLRAFGVNEPLVGESIRAGANLVSFSGDKLLGGPQAGILAGDPRLVTRLRRNPMFRALRLDKLIYQSLETTLRHVLLERWDQIPILRMISISADELRTRAERFAARLDGVSAEVLEGSSLIGGGSTPEQPLPTWLVAVKANDIVAAERRLRLGDPPVVARIEEGRLLFDLRTVFPAEEEDLAHTIRATCAGRGTTGAGQTSIR
ncbi:MAG TPA: L-seryl-tRNA(Sec) selenium transferase [Bryobacteraceae bacterium]|nr:L-seryl-tRNA(Sec) selenium transferase [Bryobacteraceae bacterium]